MNKYTTNSPEETIEIAKIVANHLMQTGGVLALYGDLGAGKTTFTQGFAKHLGINDKVISPTFIVQRHYQIPQTHKTLFHLDLYRLETSEEFKQIGLQDLFKDPNNIVLIEWAEKAEDLLPHNTIRLKIEKGENDLRIITIDPPLP